MTPVNLKSLGLKCYQIEHIVRENVIGHYIESIINKRLENKIGNEKPIEILILSSYKYQPEEIKSGHYSEDLVYDVIYKFKKSEYIDDNKAFLTCTELFSII